jgi:hypothetical protein
MQTSNLKGVDYDPITGMYIIKANDGEIHITPEEVENLEGIATLNALLGDEIVIPISGILYTKNDTEYMHYKNIIKGYLKTKLEGYPEEEVNRAIKEVFENIFNDSSKSLKATFFLLYRPDDEERPWDIVDVLI